MSLLLDGEQTNRLSFRSMRLTDFDTWLEFFKHPETHMHWISERTSPEQECREWYKRQQQRYENDEGGMNALIETSSGRLVGHCGLLRQVVDDVNELEIGYSLLPEFWKKGFASEAALKCREHAFRYKLTSSLISIISVTNISSAKVAMKVGMRIDKSTFYKGNHVNIFRINSN